MKRQTIFSAILAMAVLFTGCNVPEMGEITEQQNINVTQGQKPIVISEDDSKIFAGSDNDTGLEFRDLNDGYGGFSIPVPSDWQLVNNEPGYRMFGDNENLVIIHYEPANESLEGMHISDKVNAFDPMIENEKFNYFGGAEVHRRELQDSPDIIVKVEDKDKFLVSREYDDIKLRDSMNNYISNEISEMRYLIGYDNMRMVISLFGPKHEVATYMAMNIRHLPVTCEEWTELEGVKYPVIPASENKNLYIGSGAFEGFFAYVSDNEEVDQTLLDEVFASAFPNTAFRNSYGYDGDSILGLDGVCTCNVESNRRFPGSGSVWQIEYIDTGDKKVLFGYPLARQYLLKPFISQ